MTVVAADVVARCLDPVIQTTDPAVITSRIAEVERRTSRTQWGEKADDGVIFLTAHMLILDARAAAGKSGPFKGALTSETAGPLARSFAAPQAVPFTKAWYLQTQWGAQYLDLQSLVFVQRTDFDGTCW